MGFRYTAPPMENPRISLPEQPDVPDIALPSIACRRGSVSSRIAGVLILAAGFAGYTVHELVQRSENQAVQAREHYSTTLLQIQSQVLKLKQLEGWKARPWIAEEAKRLSLSLDALEKRHPQLVQESKNAKLIQDLRDVIKELQRPVRILFR